MILALVGVERSIRNVMDSDTRCLQKKASEYSEAFFCFCFLILTIHRDEKFCIVISTLDTILQKLHGF